MMHTTSARRQRGITLITGMILLVLITLVMTTAFTLSDTNLKAVGNMQFREEAIAAANLAVERVASQDFTAAPAASSHDVDIDQDGDADYTVNVATPECVKAVPLTALPPTDPDASTCAVGTGGIVICYDTIWELTATVAPSGFAALTGVRATVKQGISRRMSVTQKDEICGKI